MATSSKILRYADLEQNYVRKKILLTFYHVPSGNSVTFKGMITKLSDKFTSAWNAEDVYGRSDPIANFKNTKRQISLSWQIVAASLEEAQENLSRISLLISFLYPTYSGLEGGASTITASPLMKMKFTNLVANSQDGSGLLGFVDGFNFDPIFEDEFFDPEPGKLYPKGVDMSCNFTVLHTHPLGWAANKETRIGKFPYGSSLVPGGYKTPEAASKRNMSIADEFTSKTAPDPWPQSINKPMDNQSKAQEDQILKQMSVPYLGRYGK